MEDGYTADDAHEFGIHRIWDDDLRRCDLLRPGEQLFICFEGLCMGWSWSLYLCQKFFEHLVASQHPLGLGGALRDRAGSWSVC
eukprot:3628045-Pyramimonas_sp.AAC.1